MLARVLQHFPPQTHALTLVRDPDGVLADEAVLTALTARGFRLIDMVSSRDPVALRYYIEQARPWTATAPLIVVTEGDLSTLPYDVWRQGHRVTLALHTVFPRLAYPVVRSLTATQRARLAQAPSPAHRLGQRATREHILRHVFDADVADLQTPVALVTWLDAYHAGVEPLPPDLAVYLLEQLEARGGFAGWPLLELLRDYEAFVTFVREQWQAYVHRPPGQRLDEAGGAYLDFGADTALQDVLPALVREGTLAPVPVPHPERMPAWARPALLAREAERVPRRVAELADHVAASLAALPSNGDLARWTQWQPLAWAWAELTALRYAHDAEIKVELRETYARLRQRLDARFLTWLQVRYTPLAARALPTPHHGHHIPTYLAHTYPPKDGHRVALLVMDGMALADWFLIAQKWRARHPDWCLTSQLVLAQVPTITSVARQALVSGRRPADFGVLDAAASVHTSRAEPKLWTTFWASADVPPDACPTLHLSPSGGRTLPEPLTSARTRAVCLVNTQIDALMHGVTLGSEGFYAALDVWLQGGEAVYVETVIEAALQRGFSVALTSDHGHTQARGIGTPSAGALVETRGKRARLYEDRALAARDHAGFPDTVLWDSDGLLPEGVSALLPRDDGPHRAAFAQRDRVVISHGGVSLDEVVVPLVVIAREF